MKLEYSGTSARRKRSVGYGCELGTRLGVILLLLFSPSGKAQAPLCDWIFHAGGNDSDKAFGIDVDAGGGVFLTGDFKGTAYFGSSSVSSSFENLFFMSLDVGGEMLWVRTAHGIAHDPQIHGRALKIDRSGGIYLAGYFHGDVYLPPGLRDGLVSSPNIGLFYAKYDSTGNLITHIEAASGSSYSYGLLPASRLAMDVDAPGNVSIGGAFQDYLGWQGLSVRSSDRKIDAFVARCDRESNALWVKSAGGVEHDEVLAVCVDSNGNTYATGDFASPNATFEWAIIDNVRANSADVFLAKYGPTGSVLWALSAGGLGSDFGQAVSLDAQEDLLLAGSFTQSATFSSNTVTSRGATDIFVAKYTPDGDLLWLRRAGGAYADTATALAGDFMGNIYLAGTFQGTVDFGVHQLSASGLVSGFVAKLNSAGHFLWVKQFDSMYGCQPESIAVDYRGDCYLAGWFIGGLSVDGTNLMSLGKEDAFALKLASSEGVSPTIVENPQSQALIPGASTTFSVVATGTPPLTYRWQWRGLYLFPASTNASLTLTNLQSANEGPYRVHVSNLYGSILSSVAYLSTNTTLTVNVTTGGQVMVNPNLTSYARWQEVQLTAIPDFHYAFLRWSGDYTGSANPLELSMDTNKFVTAHFVPTRLELLTEGVGVVNKTPDQPSYEIHEEVMLSAIPGRWHEFCAWVDGITANPRIVTVGASNTYTAVFCPTTALETLTFSNVSRVAPVGMPAIFVDGEFVISGGVTREDRAEVSMLTTFPNGTVLFTLDGSSPSFDSTLYLGPFDRENSATIRAIAFNADFTKWWDTDPVALTVLARHSLHLNSQGGGFIEKSPDQDVFLDDTVVTVSVVPADDWTFMQWLGDVTGNSMTNVIKLDRDYCAEAVFGTELSITVAGQGTILVDPSVPLYAYGSVVRCTAKPEAGHYFALWGNAINSTNNPLEFVVTDSHPTLAGLFAPLSADKVTLTVVPDGNGQVRATPYANSYRRDQIVVLRAEPNWDQSFLGWSGDAAGADSPLSVVMSRSKNVMAHFSRMPRLVIHSCDGQRDYESIRLIVAGNPAERYRIEFTPNFHAAWERLADFTNTCGRVQFNDPLPVNSASRFYRCQLLP